MKHLPMGIQEFPDFTKDNYLYVDKTELIYQLASTKFSYFLSRPRRFGKSLLVSTLKALFEGKKELFLGTWLENASYDWAEYPVLSLDFSRLESVSPEKMVKSFQEYLASEAKQYNIQLDPALEYTTNFSELVTKLAKQSQVVILIDEYDAPIVSELDNPSLCAANKKVLHRIFTTIKSLQASIRFSFFTGVSKFSKVSLFSGMNSLLDLSLELEYATLLGWTEEEIRAVFSGYIETLASSKKLDFEAAFNEIRNWYNGYTFAPEGEKVFNPWSVLRCLHSKKLKNYWFETATPNFVMSLIKKRAFPAIDLEVGVRVAGHEMVANHHPDKITIPSLLFQTGYLTIADYEESSDEYVLCIPNDEVNQSLFRHVFASFIDPKKNWISSPYFDDLRQALMTENMDDFFETFNRLFASIPHAVHINAIHIKQESYYHSLIFSCVKMLGFPTHSEFGTSRGRVDMVVSTQKTYFLFEFKLNQSAAKALEQIKSTDYGRQFEGMSGQILCVGANFDSKTRSISEWEVERWDDAQQL